MTVDKNVVSRLHSNYLTLDEFAFLYQKFVQEDWNIVLPKTSILKLENNNMIDDKEELTPIGETVIVDCIGDDSPKTINFDGRFEEIWKMFPAHDGFRSFPRTRDIRVNKSEALQEYHSARARGATDEQMVEALKIEIKKRSASETQNAFTYMKSPANWFRKNGWMDSEDEETVVQKREYGKQVL